MYNADIPIINIDEDLLGRKEFATHLGKAILSFDANDSIVVGLYGGWGTGKTSIINMTTNMINNEANKSPDNKKPLIIKFEPWLFQDDVNLINQFFTLLKEKLGLKEYAVLKEAIGDLIDEYSKVINIASIIPEVGIFGNLISKAISFFGRLLKKNNQDIESIKNKLSSKLRKQEQKIIVVIDDIDRLSNKQIRMIFQLVKQVANLPNITYLLSMDKDVVARALKEVQNCDGNEYLEKIVQVPFEIPTINKNTLDRILLEKLDKVFPASTEDPYNEEEQNHWAKVYNYCVKPYINTIRDVNRLINVLAFKNSIMNNEVNTYDLIGISAIEMQNKKLLNWIIDNKEGICGNPNRLRGISISEQEDNKSKYINELNGYIGNNSGHIALKAITALFPRVERETDFGYSDISENELRARSRIASSSKFDLYFRLDPNEIVIPKAEIQRAINNMDIDELMFSFRYYNSKGQIIDYLDELQGRADSIPYDRIKMFIKTLYKMKTTFKGEKGANLFSMSAESYVRAFTDKLFERLNSKDEVYEILSEAIKEGDILTIQGMCEDINRIELAYGRLAGERTNERDQIISLDQLKKLEKMFSERMKEFAKNDTVLDAKFLYFINYLWKSYDPDTYDAYYKKKLADNFSKLKFISKIGGLWTGTDGRGWGFSSNRYDDFMSYEEVCNIINEYDKKEMYEKFTEEEILKFAFFVLNENDFDHATENEARDKINEWKVQW